MPAMKELAYCNTIWLGVFGFFVVDIFAVVLAMMKVPIVWLRIVIFMAGVALILSLPFVLVFSGCGIV